MNEEYSIIRDPNFVTISQPDITIKVIPNGWTLIPANIERTNLDGSKDVVQKVFDWVGGYGTKPPINVYVGENGFVTDISLAKSIKGFNGWTPQYSSEIDGARRLIKLTDWIGGQGTKPPVGLYITPEGFSPIKANATDFRGAQGLNEDEIIDLVVTTGVAFNSISVISGGTLPVTTQPEFLFVGAGTFNKPGGGTIVTTQPLNVLSSNGSVWSLNAAIPIVPTTVSPITTRYYKKGELSSNPSGEILVAIKDTTIADIAQITGSFMKQGLSASNIYNIDNFYK